MRRRRASCRRQLRAWPNCDSSLVRRPGHLGFRQSLPPSYALPLYLDRQSVPSRAANSVVTTPRPPHFIHPYPRRTPLARIVVSS